MPASVGTRTPATKTPVKKSGNHKVFQSDVIPIDDILCQRPGVISDFKLLASPRIIFCWPDLMNQEEKITFKIMLPFRPKSIKRGIKLEVDEDQRDLVTFSMLVPTEWINPEHHYIHVYKKDSNYSPTSAWAVAYNSVVRLIRGAKFSNDIWMTGTYKLPKKVEVNFSKNTPGIPKGKIIKNIDGILQLIVVFKVITDGFFRDEFDDSEDDIEEVTTMVGELNFESTSASPIVSNPIPSPSVSSRARVIEFILQRDAKRVKRKLNEGNVE